MQHKTILHASLMYEVKTFINRTVITGNPQKLTAKLFLGGFSIFFLIPRKYILKLLSIVNMYLNPIIFNFLYTLNLRK